MNYLNLSFIKKVDFNGLNNNENNNYKKYIAKKIIINKNNTTDGWLMINKLLPINRGENKNKILEANIIKKKKVVVKISKYKNLLEKDYNVSIKLEELKCKNFAKYLGFFSCKDELNNYDITKQLPKYFCKNNGTINYFIFMNYYKLGSIINYIPKNIEEIITIINQVFGSMIYAFEQKGFIHGDLHPGNVLLEKTNLKKIKYPLISKNIEVNTYSLRVILFDFDRSNFSKNFSELLNELSTFINLYERYLIKNKVFDNEVLPLRELKKELYKVTDIEKLKLLIGD